STTGHHLHGRAKESLHPAKLEQNVAAGINLLHVLHGHMFEEPMTLPLGLRLTVGTYTPYLDVKRADSFEGFAHSFVGQANRPFKQNTRFAALGAQWFCRMEDFWIKPVRHQFGVVPEIVLQPCLDPARFRKIMHAKVIRERGQMLPD